MFTAASATAAFGFGRTSLQLIALRFALGLLNGQSGIARLVMAEIPMVSCAWQVGATIGPVIGGYLESPAKHFRLFMGSRFFQ